MALRDQPYLPLYVQDFMTDEKLIECSASTTGVYIRIMCIMHKSEDYGKVLLKQKYKQNNEQTLNFATQLAKSLPYDLSVIHDSINELVFEKVLELDGDLLIQKRMVKDNDISIKRSLSGSKGGVTTQEKNSKLAKKFAKAKTQANTEYEDETDNESKVKIDYDNLKLYWNTAFEKTKIPKIQTMTDGRKKAVTAVLKRYTKEQVKETIDKVKKSGFLNGDTKSEWKVSFDWLFIIGNFTKVLEGNYDDGKQPIQAQTTRYNNLDSTKNYD